MPLICNPYFLSVLLVASVGASRDGVDTDAENAYTDFQLRHGARDFAQDSLGYEERLKLFQQRQAEVEALNARKDASWTAGLTHFADWTEAEFRGLLNYRRTGHSSEEARPASFLELQPNRHVTVAESMDWRSRANNSKTFLRNQLGCGSCWAVAAVGVLEMHAEIHHAVENPQKLSFEQLVDCTPNPQHCGGTGGCKGATSELAFQYVTEHGVDPADHYKGYLSGGDGKCKAPASEHRVQATGFERLPLNKYQPLLETLATKGPLAVSVDAGPWSLYEGGVFADCPKDATINHAVVMLGYGRDKEQGMDYWLIRNSWGASWGEAGHIRLQRVAHDEGDEGHCGWDNDPKEGTGCDGGPSKLRVCGMCGVLSDSSYPKSVNMVV